jgi:ferric-dicitrate binding protein FerR (iron transport regulator)
LEKQALISLIDRYLDGTATELEQEMVLNYFDSFQGENRWNEAKEGSLAAAEAERFERIKKQIAEQQHSAPVRPIRRIWLRYAAAAILVLATAGTLLLLKPWKQSSTEAVAYKQLEDIKPASKKAYLTIEGGKQIPLDSIRVGEQVGAAVKTAEGMIAYTNSANQPVTYHTITVPRGGEPQMIQLPDTSEVWLNSGSSITYATAFGKERLVNMTGEAYYEVRKNGKPFIVQTPTDKIEVLGTHFNIHAYSDDGAVKTTLLEGKVRIGNTVLAPDEQYESGKIMKLDNSAIQRVMAWKNGLFSYNDVDVQTLMRDLGRAYDVEVVYEGEPTKRRFKGAIDRGLSLKDVLEGLAFKKVNFRIEQGPNGNRIIMLP